MQYSNNTREFTMSETRTIASVLAKFRALKVTDNPMFAAIVPMVSTLENALKRMSELRVAIGSANKSPETVIAELTPEDVASLSEGNEEIGKRYASIQKLRARLEREQTDLAAIVSPPMSEDVKAKLTGEFAEKKADVFAFFGILGLVKDDDLSDDGAFIHENLPTLRGTGRGIASERKAEDISAEIRAWVHDNSVGNVKVAGMQFGHDGRDYGIQENGEKVYLSSRGRIPDAFFRTFREFKGVTFRA